MTLATIIMIVLICVGCALLLAALAVAGISAWRMVKAARKAGINSKSDLEEVTRRIKDLGPRLQEMQERQEAVAERLQSLSATVNNLKYLRDEIDRSTGYLFKLKS